MASDRGNGMGASARAVVVITMLALLLAPSAAGSAAGSFTTVAAKDLLTILPAKNDLFNAIAPGHVHVKTVRVGVLRFAAIRGPIHGAIACVYSNRDSEGRWYGCRWTVHPRVGMTYWGSALLHLYFPQPQGFNIAGFVYKCRDRTGSHVCKTHPMRP